MSIEDELRIAAAEHSAPAERIAALQAALSRTLDREMRLAALMEIDAIIQAQRSRAFDVRDVTPTKIDIAKAHGEDHRLARSRAERIAAGLPTRSRRARPPQRKVS